MFVITREGTAAEHGELNPGIDRGKRKSLGFEGGRKSSGFPVPTAGFRGLPTQRFGRSGRGSAGRRQRGFGVLGKCRSPEGLRGGFVPVACAAAAGVPGEPGRLGGWPAPRHTGIGSSSPRKDEGGKCWKTPLKGQTVGATRLPGLPPGGTAAGAARGRRRVRLQLPRCRRDAGPAKRGERRRTGKAKLGSPPAAPSPSLAPSSPPSRPSPLDGARGPGGTTGTGAGGRRAGKGPRSPVWAPLPGSGHRHPAPAQAFGRGGARGRAAAPVVPVPI